MFQQKKITASQVKNQLVPKKKVDNSKYSQEYACCACIVKKLADCNKKEKDFCARD